MSERKVLNVSIIKFCLEVDGCHFRIYIFFRNTIHRISTRRKFRV